MADESGPHPCKLATSSADMWPHGEPGKASNLKSCNKLKLAAVVKLITVPHCLLFSTGTEPSDSVVSVTTTGLGNEVSWHTC